MTIAFNRSIALLFGLCCLAAYMIAVFSGVTRVDVDTVFLSLISLAIFIAAVGRLSMKVSLANLFSTTWFGLLFLYSLELSSLQTGNNPSFLWFAICVPIIFMLELFLLESVPAKPIRLNARIVDVRLFYYSLLILYVAIKIYVGSTLGFRIASYYEGSLLSGDLYSLPGWTGVSTLLQWSLLIFMAYQSRRGIVLGVVAIILFSVILHVKRGDLIRIALFLFLLFLERRGKIKLRDAVVLIVFGAVLLEAFSLFGEWRLSANGIDKSYIVSLLDSKVDSVLIAWAYAYTAFIFEILKHYIDVAGTLNETGVGYFLSALWADFEKPATEYSLHGFNAATFLAPAIVYTNYFYMFYVLVLGWLMCSFLYYCRLVDFRGLRVFVLMLGSLLFFGDYVTERGMIYSMFFAAIMFPFLRLPLPRSERLYVATVRLGPVREREEM